MKKTVAGDSVAPVFQRDKFLLWSKLEAVAETHHVWDEQGTPILLVKCPPRLTRLALAVLLTFLTFLGVWFSMTLLLMAGLWLLDAGGFLRVNHQVFAAWGHASLPVGGITGLILAVRVFSKVLGRQHFTLYAAETKGQTLLEVRPDKIGWFTTEYTVSDGQGSCLARLRTNHLYNVLHERWWAYRPDGSAWVLAEDRSAVPRILREVLRSGVGLVCVLGILAVLYAAAVLFWKGQWAVLRFFLVPVLGGLVLCGYFLIRRLHSNCVILTPDQDGVIGELHRQSAAQDPAQARNVLDLGPDSAGILDRRVAVALGILLDIP